MLVLKGKSVNTGITIGPLALFHRNTISTAERKIEDVAAEIDRFQAAREAAIRQLQALYENTRYLSSGSKNLNLPKT